MATAVRQVTDLAPHLLGPAPSALGHIDLSATAELTSEPAAREVV